MPVLDRIELIVLWTIAVIATPIAIALYSLLALAVSSSITFASIAAGVAAFIAINALVDAMID